ncbi:MAG: metalloregulator ArsR/SmtB family transcription factor [Verrucomicrobiota bacterium]
MPKTTTDDWIHLLKALADDTRLRIVKLLLDGSMRVGQISESLSVSTYNTSKHLRVLREAKLIVMAK